VAQTNKKAVEKKTSPNNKKGVEKKKKIQTKFNGPLVV
jgi:hypothetical protein